MMAGHVRHLAVEKIVLGMQLVPLTGAGVEYSITKKLHKCPVWQCLCN